MNERLTRGFINRDAAVLRVDGKTYDGIEALGFPAVSPMKTEKIGMTYD